MAIAKVQSTSKVVGFVGNNTTLAFSSNVTAGNLLVVTHVHWAVSGLAITTPTDTLGHTYLPVAAEQSAGGGLLRLRSFYVANCSGGANTVTFDVAGTDTAELAVVVSEFSGVAKSSPLDTTNTGTGTGTAVSSGNVTPSIDNCLLFGATTSDSNNVGLTEEAGWTLLEEQIPAGSIPVGTAFKVQTTAAAEDADWTLASSQEWLAHVGVFKPELKGRTSQVVVESLSQIDPKARATQIVTEALSQGTPTARASQFFVEVLSSVAESAAAAHGKINQYFLLSKLKGLVH